MVNRDTDTDEPMPRVQWLGAIHVRDDGTTLHRLTGEDWTAAHQRFELLRSLAAVEEPTWQQEISA